jgi:hypothetical protein
VTGRTGGLARDLHRFDIAIRGHTANRKIESEREETAGIGKKDRKAGGEMISRSPEAVDRNLGNMEQGIEDTERGGPPDLLFCSLFPVPGSLLACMGAFLGRMG